MSRESTEWQEQLGEARVCEARPEPRASLEERLFPPPTVTSVPAGPPEAVRRAHMFEACTLPTLPQKLLSLESETHRKAGPVGLVFMNTDKATMSPVTQGRCLPPS